MIVVWTLFLHNEHKHQGACQLTVPALAYVRSWMTDITWQGAAAPLWAEQCRWPVPAGQPARCWPRVQAWAWAGQLAHGQLPARPLQQLPGAAGPHSPRTASAAARVDPYSFCMCLSTSSCKGFAPQTLHCAPCLAHTIQHTICCTYEADQQSNTAFQSFQLKGQPKGQEGDYSSAIQGSTVVECK